MSGIPRLSYDLGKIWLLYLIYLTEYEALCKYMSLLDIDSLFKNIGLEKKIDICIDSLFSENESPYNLQACFY